MKTFVTADPHFGHANIIKYCARPFRDLEHMNVELVRRFNERVKPEDICFFLGDFCFKNSPGGDQNEGVPVKWTEYIGKLNGAKVFIRGNHDGNNSTKTIIENLVVNYGGFRIGMVHDPADFLESTEWNKVDFNLCGHVHQNWKHVWRGPSLEHLLINVGVDVWKFYPMTLEEILNYRGKIIKEQATYQQRFDHNGKASILEAAHKGLWDQ